MLRRREAHASTPIPPAPPPPSGAGCPVAAAATSTDGSYRHPHVYNVYGERINLLNRMPATADQAPAAGQVEVLDTHRVRSTIPKGGTEGGTWEYPSQQMFFNALKRKNKADGISEADMDVVVAVHNNVNEKTWRAVLEWEALHSDVCAHPTLLRFIGRPFELSPKAWLLSWFGPPPFDRHDWVVDRCGSEVRYVIDFYAADAVGGATGIDGSGVVADAAAMLHSGRGVRVDVRPALDSPSAAWDRVRMAARAVLAGDHGAGANVDAAGPVGGAASEVSDRVAAGRTPRRESTAVGALLAPGDRPDGAAAAATAAAAAATFPTLPAAPPSAASPAAAPAPANADAAARLFASALILPHGPRGAPSPRGGEPTLTSAPVGPTPPVAAAALLAEDCAAASRRGLSCSSPSECQAARADVAFCAALFLCRERAFSAPRGNSDRPGTPPSVEDAADCLMRTVGRAQLEARIRA